MKVEAFAVFLFIIFIIFIVYLFNRITMIDTILKKYDLVEKDFDFISNTLFLMLLCIFVDFITSKTSGIVFHLLFG